MKPNNTILLIDDEPANLRILSEIIEQQNLETMAVLQAEAGLELAVSEQPALILLDINMPGMDGFEVYRRLKAAPVTRDIPVIFTTIMADLESKVAGFELGAVDYIAKPFERVEVKMRVMRHLELACLRRELEEKNKALEGFAHTVSHSLKNPLARLETLLVLLQENSHSPDFATQAMRLLPLAQQAVRQGRNTTEALLLLAEISTAQIIHTIQPVNVRASAQQAAHSLQNLIDAKHAQLRWSSDSWPNAIGYQPWIEEIWRNYLENALKYGGNPPVIDIGAQHHGDYVEYWIKDNGKGIEVEDQALLFNPFTRLQLAEDGHGLGLSIVQSIVKRLGGEAGMSSAPGKGARFYFRLKHSR
jgi:signal transduction histidine kinase